MIIYSYWKLFDILFSVFIERDVVRDRPLLVLSTATKSYEVIDLLERIVLRGLDLIHIRHNVFFLLIVRIIDNFT